MASVSSEVQRGNSDSYAFQMKSIVFDAMDEVRKRGGNLLENLPFYQRFIDMSDKFPDKTKELLPLRAMDRRYLDMLRVGEMTKTNLPQHELDTVA